VTETNFGRNSCKCAGISKSGPSDRNDLGTFGDTLAKGPPNEKLQVEPGEKISDIRFIDGEVGALRGEVVDVIKRLK
jgi:hypothetical protein